MALALREAARAVGRTHPNPPVGCVVVRDGTVVGRGHTQAPPGPHAEVVALRQAGEAARGAALYVTLEPCSHAGRTPPCTETIITAGVSRVVAGVRDPNPVASGGFEALSQAGLATGLVDAGGRVEAFLAPFLHWARTGRPYVVLKAAMTLDGKTASASGESRWITGPVARAYAHRLRARLGAVMVGIGTALADDPLLTVRHDHSARVVASQPVRIVVDPSLRLPASSRLVKSSAEGRVMVACGESADTDRERALEASGVQVVRVAEQGRRLDFAILLAELGTRGVTAVLAEGGGELAFSVLESGLAQEVLYFVAPLLMGGRAAHSPLDGEGYLSPAEGIPVHGLVARKCGRDWVLRGKILSTQPSAPNPELTTDY